MDIVNALFSMKDKKYKEFHCSLIPTVNPDTVIGVRTPIVRKLAGEISGTPIAAEFLKKLPHRFYEENNLHVFLVNGIKDYDECISEINRFLPFIDNWATCDSLRPKSFAKNKKKLFSEIEKWIKSDRIYTVRFAIEMLMVLYLDKDFDEKYLHMVASVSSGEYYIKMMIAWCFATALAKQWEKTLPYIEDGVLEKWTHNKTISKAIESFRITDEQKTILRKMKK